MMFISRLIRSRRASVMLMFVLCVVPLVAMLGLAIDFGIVTLAKARLDAAADSAALKAITAASLAYNASTTSDYIGTGQAAGAQYFAAQLGALNVATASAPSIAVVRSNGVFNATVNYQADVPTAFARVVGFPSFALAGSSASTLTAGGYVAIQVLMDTSASMGLLVNSADSSTLLAAIQQQVGTTAPSNGSTLVASAADRGIVTVSNYAISPTSGQQAICSFACHFDNSTSGPGGYSNDYYGIARASGLQLRVDVLRSAVQSIIQQVQTSSAAGFFQFGLYTFDSQLNTVYPLSADLAGAYNAANAVTVSPLTPYCTNGATPPLCGDPNGAANGFGAGFRDGAIADTNFTASANSLVSQTLTPKPTIDGTHPATAFRYMFIITDGVDDYTSTTARDSSCCNQFISPMGTTNGIDNSPLSGPSACDAIKAAGVTILVLYTPYNPVIPADTATFVNSVEPLLAPTNQVVSNLQACASPGGNYFTANSASEISAALQKMLDIASTKAGRFTH